VIDDVLIGLGVVLILLGLLGLALRVYGAIARPPGEDVTQ
jgi:Na+-transporting methylmalonyl-CoA/oxaloacetate decarboxylase gamma subunit